MLLNVLQYIFDNLGEIGAEISYIMLFDGGVEKNILKIFHHHCIKIPFFKDDQVEEKKDSSLL